MRNFTILLILQFECFKCLHNGTEGVSFKNKAIEHHEPKLTTPSQIQRTHTNSPNKTLLHLNLGEKPKEAAVNRAVVTNVVSRQKLRPAASQSGNSNSSTTSPSSSSRTHFAVDPHAPTKRRQKAPVMAPMQPRIPATLHGGLTSSM
jgi:hypothetical protein